MNFFLDDPMNSFVENLLMKSTEKAKKKKPAPGKYNPYDDSPLLAPTSHDGKDPGTPQYGKHWSSYAPRARMAETKMKRRKELQLVLDTIEQLYAVTEKAKKKSGKDDDLSTYFTNRTSYKPFKMERGGPDKRSRNLSRNPGAKTPRILFEDESHDRIARLADVRRRRGIPTMTGVRGKELLDAVTEKAKKKGEKKGIQTPPALPLEDNSSKPLRGKHWSQWKSPRLAENQMKRRKELQLVLDTIEEKAKKEPKPTKTPKPPRLRGESAAERIKRVKEELAKLRGSSNKQLSGGERDVDFTPPEGVRSAARRGIEYHSKGLAGDGFMSATLIRAHKIADGNELTLEHVKRMHSFFERHANGRSQKAKKGEVTPWDVAWLAWGGNAGRSWAASKVAVAQKAKKTIIVVPPFPKEGHDYVNGKNIPHRLDRYKRPMTRYEDGSYGSEPLKRREPVKSKDGPTPPSSNKGNRLRNDAVKTTMPDRSVKYVDKRKRR